MFLPQLPTTGEKMMFISEVFSSHKFLCCDEILLLFAFLCVEQRSQNECVKGVLVCWSASFISETAQWILIDLCVGEAVLEEVVRCNFGSHEAQMKNCQFSKAAHYTKKLGQCRSH